MSDLNKDMHSRSYDPLREVKTDSPALAKAWLKNGYSLTPVQRVGYTIFSFGYIGVGCFTLGASIDGFYTGDIFIPLCFGVAATFFFYFGLRGLKNVLRFQKESE